MRARAGRELRAETAASAARGNRGRAAGTKRYRQAMTGAASAKRCGPAMTGGSGRKALWASDDWGRLAKSVIGKRWLGTAGAKRCGPAKAES